MTTTAEHAEFSASANITTTDVTDIGSVIILDNEKPFFTVAVTHGGGTEDLSAFDLIIVAAKGAPETTFDGYTVTNNLATTTQGTTESATIRIGNVYSVQPRATLAGVPGASTTISIIGRASSIG